MHEAEQLRLERASWANGRDTGEAVREEVSWPLYKELVRQLSQLATTTSR
jgi:hypothetical protein